MHFNWIEVLGLIAAVGTTFGFVPQITKTYQTKDVSSLSLPMYIIICLGSILWLVYGILTHSIAVTIANVVAIAFTISLVIMILRYRK